MEIISWAQRRKKKENCTLKGQGRVISQFTIPQLDRRRRIWIYLPPEYENSSQSYPVLYMHDGQNLFDKAASNDGEWQVDETLNQLFAAEETEGAIVVGIDCDSESRRDEYSPWERTLLGEGGEGNAYLDFLINTLKPYIDENYRTLPGRKNTGIAGSSMGGFISLYGGLKYQDVFSKIAAFSPAIFFHPNKLDEFIRQEGKQEWMKIYLDVGTTENLVVDEEYEIDNQDYINDVRRVYNLLHKVGFTDRELKLVEARGDEHHEEYWRDRFPAAFQWLLAKG